MSNPISPEKIRVYIGQSGAPRIYNTSFDTYKLEVNRDLQKWTITKNNEGNDLFDFVLGNPNNRFTTDYPIDYNYGVEVLYYPTMAILDDCDALTNWSESGPNIGPLALEDYIIREGTASIKVPITGAVGGSDYVVLTVSDTAAVGDMLEMWIHSPVQIDPGDLALRLMPGPMETIDNENTIPANTWTRARFPVGTGGSFTSLELFPDASLWSSGNVYLDQVVLSNPIKTVFKGELDPVDFRAGGKQNILNLKGRGIEKWATDILISRDYYQKDWFYVEDIIWDIVYNLTNFSEDTYYDISLYVPVNGTDTEMATRQAITAEYKHPTTMDFKFRSTSPDAVINQLCTTARIGYYFHADVDDGGHRLTLKSRDTSTADFIITNSSYNTGELTKSNYKRDMVARVIVIGKDVVGIQTNPEAIAVGATRTKRVNASKDATIQECAETAHLEIIKSSPDETLLTVTINAENVDYKDEFLYAEPYDVVTITDDDLDIDAESYNLIQHKITFDKAINIKWELGELRKAAWMKAYELSKEQDKREDEEVVHYRSATADVNVGFYYYRGGAVGGDITVTDTGKRELADCLTRAFFKLAGRGQRFEIGYAEDNAGNILADRAALQNQIWTHVDDTNKKVYLYLPFDWDNSTGSAKVVDHLHIITTEVSELISDAAKGATTVDIRNLDNWAANKEFDIEYRNSAKIVWIDSANNKFAVDVPDIDIFQDTPNDAMTVQQNDGSTHEITITDVNTYNQVITYTGTDPDLGATVYVDDTENCIITTVSQGATYDTATVGALSRTIQKGAKVIKYLSPAFVNQDNINLTVNNSTTLRIYLVVELTSDTTTSDYNQSYLTKEGLLFFANQLIGDPGSSKFKWYKGERFYTGIGTDNSTSLDYAWMDSYDLEMKLESAWSSSNIVVKTGDNTISVSAVPGGQSSPTLIKVNAPLPLNGDLDGDGDSDEAGLWDGFDLVFKTTANGGGANTGVRRRITDWSGPTTRILTLANPLPFFPTIGDKLYIEPSIDIGDYIYYASGDSYGGISGTETKTAFLKVVGVTASGGDDTPLDTIAAEGDHALGTDPAINETIYLIGNEKLAAEVNRGLSSTAVVSLGYDKNTYVIKIGADFKDTYISVDTDADGLSTGIFNTVKEMGIFSGALVQESALQYYLGDRLLDGELVALGHGDDPYDNLVSQNLNQLDGISPRSDYFDTDKIVDVRGFKANDVLEPHTISFGYTNEWRGYDYPRLVEWFWAYGSILRGFSENFATLDATQGYAQLDIEWTGRLPYATTTTDRVITSTPGLYAPPEYDYMVNIFNFVIQRDTTSTDLREMTFFWGGFTNYPVRVYAHVNRSGDDQGYHTWREIQLKSGAGINSQDLEASISDERYFYGSASIAGDDLWKIIHPYTRQVTIMLIAGNPTDSFSTYLYTDMAYLSFSTGGVGETGAWGNYRRGIDYYDDDSGQIWWDFVDPIQFASTISEVIGLTGDGLFRIIPVDISPFEVGNKVYIEVSTGNFQSSSVMSKGDVYLDLALYGLGPDEPAAGDTIHIVNPAPATTTITINGKEYDRQVPGKQIANRNFDGMKGRDSILAFDGFEGGVGGDDITANNSTFVVTGDPEFVSSTVLFGVGDCAGRFVNETGSLELGFSTTGLEYLTASVDLYIFNGGTNNQLSIELLDSSDNICAGIRFDDDSSTYRIYFYDSDAWAYSDGTYGYDYRYTETSENYRVSFLFNLTTGAYQAYVNGIAITDDPGTAVTFSNTYILPTKFRVTSENANTYATIDTMYVGRGTCSEFDFITEEYMSLAESTVRKRGYLQYAPSEVTIQSEGNTYSSLLDASWYKLMKQSILENIENEKIYISRLDTDLFTAATNFIFNTYSTFNQSALDPKLEDVNVTRRIAIDSTAFQIEDDSATVLGDNFYGVTPATYDARNPTTLISTKTGRHCHFYIGHDGHAANDTMVELWTREGFPKFGYLSGYSFNDSTPKIHRTLTDQASCSFGEQATVGCLTMYKINLTPTERHAERWENDPAYDLTTGDDYCIIDEEFQPKGGFPRFQPNMQIGFSDVAGNNPTPNTEVEHFLVRKVEAWPRNSEEWWTDSAATYNLNDNILTDWMWIVTGEDGASVIETVNTDGYRRTGVLRLTGDTSIGNVARVQHTTRLANKQVFSTMLKASTGGAAASGYIRMLDETGTVLLTVDIDDGSINEEIGGTTLDAFSGTSEWYEISIEIDYGSSGQYKVYTKEISTGITAESAAWIDFDTSGTVRQIEIAAEYKAAATALDVGLTRIFGGNQSDPKLYVHLTHTTDANRRLAADYDVSDGDFDMWKWMDQRACHNLVWVNPFVGLKQGDTASVNMFYEQGANYLIRYAKGNGICLVRSLLGDASSDHPITVLPGERVNITQEIRLLFGGD